MPAHLRVVLEYRTPAPTHNGDSLQASEETLSVFVSFSSQEKQGGVEGAPRRERETGTGKMIALLTPSLLEFIIHHFCLIHH